MPNAHGKPRASLKHCLSLWSFQRRFSVKQIDFGVKILPTFATFFCKSMEKRRTFFNKGVSKEKFRAERFCESATQENSTTKSSTVSVDRRFRQKSFSVLFSCARNSAKSVALNYLVVRKISTKCQPKCFSYFALLFCIVKPKVSKNSCFFTCERDLNLWFIIFWHFCKNSKCNFPIGHFV